MKSINYLFKFLINFNEKTVHISNLLTRVCWYFCRYKTNIDITEAKRSYRILFLMRNGLFFTLGRAYRRCIPRNFFYPCETGRLLVFNILTSRSIISLGCGASGLSPGISSMGMPSLRISFSRYRNFLSISSHLRTSLTNLRWKALTSGFSCK